MGLIRKLLFAVVVFAVLLVAGLFMLPKERIAKVASTELSKMLGRDVVLSGDLGISIWPVLGVQTGPARVASPEWSGDAPLLHAEAMNIGVSAAAALRGDIEIQRLELVNPNITLVRAKDGRASWAFGEAGGEDSSAGSTATRQRNFSLARAEVRGGSLLYVDNTAGTREKLSGLNLVVSAPKLAGPAKLSGSVVRGKGTLSVEATLANAAEFLAGKLVGVNAGVSAPGGSLRFDGQASMALNAKGALKVDASNTAQFLSALGLDASAPPKGLGQSIALNASVTYTGAAINLRAMKLQLDQNALSGDVDVRFDQGDRPSVTARLTAGALDLASLASEGGSGESSSTGWSTARIDAGGLATLNASARLTASSVDLGMIKLGASDMNVTLDNSRAVFKLNKAAGYGGTLVGEFVINNRKGLSVGGDMSMLQADVQALLTDLAGIDRIAGNGDGQIKFLGSGSNLAAIMSSLSGSGGVAMGKGKINGFDLDKLMKSGDGSGGTTIFNTLGASFKIAGGNLTNDNLNMALTNFKTTGKGRIGLGARDIDYTFVPTATSLREGKGLAIPVRIRGTWANFKIQPDLKGAIDLNFSEEKEKVKNQAKDKVKEKLEQELGVTVKEGQKVEDAVKEKVEDKLKEKLLKILE